MISAVYSKYDNWYHDSVAARKPAVRQSNKKNSRSEKGSQAIVIFWLVFVIVIIIVFAINAQTIKKNIDLFMNRITSSPGAETDFDEDEISGIDTDEPLVTGGDRLSDQIVVIPDSSTGSSSAEPARTEDTQPVTQPSENTTQTQPSENTTQTQQPPVQTPVQTRERSIYFTQIDKDGQILQSRVTRNMPVTESPMVDVLNAMLAGPSSEEINRGILNLIPRNTRILNATIRGTTAYISFSEDFLFNTFGVEGYVAQLRQIVWTVTEFSTVDDVQVLIEGRRMDYLGEGIYIGSPISRLSF